MHSFTTGINFAAEFNKLTKTHKPMFKMTLLLSALAVATGVAAQQPATPAGIEKRMPATPELKKTDGVYTFGNQKKPKVSVSELAEKGLQAKEVSKTVMSSRLNRAPFFKEIWENPDYEWKLDSVIGHGPDGDPTIRQTMEFDERGNSKVLKNYVWNLDTDADWLLQNSEELEWNEANSPIYDKIVYYSEWGNTGRDIHYNYGEDLMYPESAEFYSLEASGEWTLTQKSLWKYDANGFMTEELIQVPSADGSLVNYSKVIAAYTPTGQVTLQEGYAWENGDWVPVGSRLMYEFDDQDRLVFFMEQMWNGEEWEGFQRIRQEWSEAGLTYQSLEYYNPVDKNWNGNEYLASSYATIEYDELLRPVLEKGHTWDTDENDWVNNVNITNAYEDLEDGGYRNIREMIWLEEDYISNHVVFEFNKVGNQTYMREEVASRAGDPLMPLVEIIAMYDETGKNVIGQYNYEFDGETRLAFVKQKNTWNEYGLPTESYFWHGKLIETGDGEPDEWEYYTHFIYDTSNGVEEGRWCYRWDGEEFVPSWADARTFDFSVPVDLCCYWLQTDLEGAKYMTTSKRVYYGVGQDWAYEEGIYYNSKFEQTGIDAPRVNGEIRISPNPVVDRITVTGVDADRFDIYSMQGALLISSDDPEIDASSLAPGVYLLNAGGQSFKFIKR